MEANITKGKWEISNPMNLDNNKTTDFSIVVHGEGKTTGICELSKIKKTLDEIKANAELIANAPETKKQRDELLSACMMAKEELCFGGDWKNAKRIIEQAIKEPK